jgi:hypothetical protein
MDGDWFVPAIAGGIVGSIALSIHALSVRGVRSRRNAWRRAAQRAGLRPELGPWVVARVAGTWLEAGDDEVGHSRGKGGYSYESGLRAPLHAALPDALTVSTSSHEPGIVRARFPAGNREVVVRGIDESAVASFLAGGTRAALAAFFSEVPDAVLMGKPLDSWERQPLFLGLVEPEIDWDGVTGVLRVRHRSRISEAAIDRELSAFVRLVEALHDAKPAYR